MGVESPNLSDVDRITDLWVALARDQRPLGSHLVGEANRTVVRDAVAERVVDSGVLVSRAGEESAAVGDHIEPDRIVGFVMFGPEMGSYDLDVARGVVENIYVEPPFRGEGRGAELLDAAERRLFDTGFDRVCLEVLTANDAAQRFYERHGYTPHRVELEKGPKNDRHSKGE